MTLLAVTPLDLTTGLGPTLIAAAGGGDTVKAAPNNVLEVANGSGSSINVTITVPRTLDTGVAYPSKVYAVAAGARAKIPVPLLFADPVTGLVAIAYSLATTVTVGAFSF
jgi:hypothetical protein